MPMNSPFKSVGKASCEQFQHKCMLDAQPHRRRCISGVAGQREMFASEAAGKSSRVFSKAIGEKLQLNVDLASTCSIGPGLVKEYSSEK